MASTTSEAVIQVLQGFFAMHALPNILVSNNGPQFTSGTFKKFLISKGITATFHPSSNGKAECMVRSAKEALARLEKGDWNQRVSSYLFTQHITLCTATGQGPDKLLMGRCLHTPLDRLHLDFAVIELLGCTKGPMLFVLGNRIFDRNYAENIPWVPALVVGITGPRSYQVVLENI